jgi:hypothetical protein
VPKIPRRVVRGKNVELGSGVRPRNASYYTEADCDSPTHVPVGLSSLETFLPQFIVSSYFEQTRA